MIDTLGNLFMGRQLKQQRPSRSAAHQGSVAPPNVGAELAAYFSRNGYVRWQDRAKLSREGYMGYKKGSEVRLTAANRKELAHVRRLLKQAGFAPGRPFLKGRQYRLPIYGFEEVERFLSLVARHGIAR